MISTIVFSLDLPVSNSLSSQRPTELPRHAIAPRRTSTTSRTRRPYPYHGASLPRRRLRYRRRSAFSKLRLDKKAKSYRIAVWQPPKPTLPIPDLENELQTSINNRILNRRLHAPPLRPLPPNPRGHPLRLLSLRSLNPSPPRNQLLPALSPPPTSKIRLLPPSREMPLRPRNDECRPFQR